MSNTEVFECPECGLHYRDKATAGACEKFCRENQACSLDITRLSIEKETVKS